MTLEIRPIDLRQAGEAEYLALHAFQNRMRAETQPDDPPVPFEERMATLCNLPPVVKVWVWTVFGREKATGRFAGYTEVTWNPHRPDLLQQQGTGVFPEFRGRGLGRWLKAAIIQKVLAERPEVSKIRTGNADSNALMLKINHALGFKPYLSRATWQVGLDKVLAYLNG
ncbi:MAG: hypothetical protein C4333_00300 [Meiothermus sp.]